MRRARAQGNPTEDQALAVAQDQVREVRRKLRDAGMRGRVISPGAFVIGR